MTTTIYVGDCKDVLPTLPANSVQCVITSPPYWGLRDYGVDGQVWGGDADCEHEWGNNLLQREDSGRHRLNWSTGGNPSAKITGNAVSQGQFCQLCSAWRGSLGLEPTPELYVEHLVEIFSQVKRVLRDDGICFINLGDSYYSGSKNIESITWSREDLAWIAAFIDSEGYFGIKINKQGRSRGWADSYSVAMEIGMKYPEMLNRLVEITGLGKPKQYTRSWRWTLQAKDAVFLARAIYPWLIEKKYQAALMCEMARHLKEKEFRGRGNEVDEKSKAYRLKLFKAIQHANQTAERLIDVPNPTPIFQCGSLKPKDLCGIPWRVAFALQANGWWLRSDIIWSKPNCMPESVTDRPTKSHEYVFLLTKSKTYYYDSDAIREEPRQWAKDRKPLKTPLLGKHRKTEGARAFEVRHYDEVKGRNRRTVWTVPTQPYSGAHFATFPPALVEPMVKAGTSERGCCAECGSPWERLISTKKYEPPMVEAGVRNVDNSRGDKTRKLDGKSKEWRETAASRETVGWRPTCTCGVDVDSGALDPNTGAGIDVRQPFEPIPCTILDCFAGAGTVGLVADRLQRDAILIELSPKYAEMARRRIEDEAPMFTRVAVERVCK